MDSDAYERLLNSALHFVSFRPRSTREISIYLKKKIEKNPSKDNVIFDRVMDRLRELDYVNDEKFATWLIESRQRHSHKGVRVIRQELMQKGVEKDLVESLLTGGVLRSSVGNQKDIAIKAVQKKYRSWSKLSIPVRKKKIYEFLYRRGFESSIVLNVIDEMVGKDYNTSIE